MKKYARVRKEMKRILEEYPKLIQPRELDRDIALCYNELECRYNRAIMLLDSAMHSMGAVEGDIQEFLDEDTKIRAMEDL